MTEYKAHVEFLAKVEENFQVLNKNTIKWWLKYSMIKQNKNIPNFATIFKS